ncbi:MAG: LCP family protein [Sarcina sp.]
MSNIKEEKNDKKTKGISSKKGIIIGVFLAIIALAIAGGAYALAILNSFEKVEIDKESLSSNQELTEKHKDIKNIALFGIDSPTNTGRSDAIMILTLDEKHKKLKLTSIMRDSYVDINGKMDKINHAYSFGGPELAIKTINENFGLNIESFLTVNFQSLGQIIDSLGGVQINITEEEVGHIPGIEKPGVSTLNGEQALAYSRIRYAKGGDYQRTQRQRNIINALYESFRYTSVTEYPNLIKGFMPYVSTNMSLSDMISIGTNYTDVISSGLEEYRFPRADEGKGIEVNGIYYLEYNLEEAGKAMREYIFEDKK